MELGRWARKIGNERDRQRGDRKNERQKRQEMGGWMRRRQARHGSDRQMDRMGIRNLMAQVSKTVLEGLREALVCAAPEPLVPQL